jgi:hypothetical protein
MTSESYEPGAALAIDPVAQDSDAVKENLPNFARREESDRALVRLQEDVSAWLAHRHQTDHYDQYRSQLNAIEGLISDALSDLRSSIAGIDVTLDPPMAYEECRLADFRTLWLRRVWQFFRDKFDQRDDDRAQPTLAAADEVVWSCYHAVFEQARQYSDDVAEGAAPLPFFESRYAPEAQPSKLVPLDLKEDLGFVHEHLERMPLSVVRIPPTCVGAPWWLTLLAHEVGHHVQYDLVEDNTLEDGFAQQLREAVEADPACAEGDGRRWAMWSAEVFADVFSVCAVGPPAISAMAYLQYREATKMLEPKQRYPPAVIRLEIMSAVGRELGLGSPIVPAQLDLGLLSEAGARHELELVPAVVRAALSPLPGLAVGLPKLCDTTAGDFLFGGFVPERAERLRNGRGAGVGGSLRAPRLMSSASMVAWTEIGRIEDCERRRVERAALARSTPDAICECREEGTREAPIMVAAAGETGHGLAAALLEAAPSLLEKG